MWSVLTLESWVTGAFDLANCCKNWYGFEDELYSLNTHWICAHRLNCILGSVNRSSRQPGFSRLDTETSRTSPASHSSTVSFRCPEVTQWKHPTLSLLFVEKSTWGLTRLLPSTVNLLRISSAQHPPQHHSSRVAISSDYHSGRTNARFRENSSRQQRSPYFFC